jgi:Cyclophilin type peptidyl-prolyl cis-trans isomerase/CLD
MRPRAWRAIPVLRAGHRVRPHNAWRSLSPTRLPAAWRLTRLIVTRLVATAVATLVSIAQPAAQNSGRVLVFVGTDLGEIVLEIDATRAPITSANFLRYLDAGHYDGGIFHRTVKMDDQPDNPVKIEVIQAGVNPDRAGDGLSADSARAHEHDRLAPCRRRHLHGTGTTGLTCLPYRGPVSRRARRCPPSR